MRSNAASTSGNKVGSNYKSKKTINSKKKSVFLRDRYDPRELNSATDDSKDATLVERNLSIAH